MGTVKSGTEPFPGWVPGPNPFGNQRASDCETWYRIEGFRQFEVRLDYTTDLWQVNHARYTKAIGTHTGMVKSSWGVFRPLTYQQFADPVGAMLWFELNKADL